MTYDLLLLDRHFTCTCIYIGTLVVPEEVVDLSGEVAAMLPPLEALCMMAMEPGILVPCLSPLVRMVGARPPPSIPPP